MEWTKAIATIIQAMAVCGAAGIAWRGLTTWRREMVGRRRSELAEQTLAMFYEARDLLAYARFPVSTGGEGETRPRELHESQGEARYRDALFVPVERLNKQTEFWGHFDASRYRFRSVFGDDAAQSFEIVRAARNRVMAAATMLARLHEFSDQQREGLADQRERLERQIGWGATEDDELGRQVDEAVTAMEDVCRPAILGATN